MKHLSGKSKTHIVGSDKEHGGTASVQRLMASPTTDWKHHAIRTPLRDTGPAISVRHTRASVLPPSDQILGRTAPSVLCTVRRVYVCTNCRSELRCSGLPAMWGSPMSASESSLVPRSYQIRRLLPAKRRAPPGIPS